MSVGKNASASSTEQQHKSIDLTLDDDSKNSSNNDKFPKEFKEKSEKRQRKKKNKSKNRTESSNESKEDFDDMFIVIDDITESDISTVISEGESKARNSAKEFQNKMKDTKDMPLQLEVIDLIDPSSHRSSLKQDKKKERKHLRKSIIENHCTNETITELLSENTTNIVEEIRTNDKFNVKNVSAHNDECTNVAMDNAAEYKPEIHLKREMYPAVTESKQKIERKIKSDCIQTHTKIKNEDLLKGALALKELKQNTVKNISTNKIDSKVEVVIQVTKNEKFNKEENVLTNSKVEKLKEDKIKSCRSTEETDISPLVCPKEDVSLSQDVVKSTETSTGEKSNNLKNENVSATQIITDLSNKIERSPQNNEMILNEIEEGDIKNKNTTKTDTVLRENLNPEIILNNYVENNYVGVTRKDNIGNQEISTIKDFTKEKKRNGIAGSRSRDLVNLDKTESSTKCVNNVNKNSTKVDASNLVNHKREESVKTVQSLTLSEKENEKESNSFNNKTKIPKQFEDTIKDDAKKQDKINVEFTSNQNVETLVEQQNSRQCEDKIKMEMHMKENMENITNSTAEKVNMEKHDRVKTTNENKDITNSSNKELIEIGKTKTETTAKNMNVENTNSAKDDTSNLEISKKVKSANKIRTLTVLKKDNKEGISIRNIAKVSKPEDVKMQEKTNAELSSNSKNMQNGSKIKVVLPRNENVENMTISFAEKMENIDKHVEEKTKKVSSKEVTNSVNKNEMETSKSKKCKKRLTNKSPKEERKQVSSKSKDQKPQKDFKIEDEININAKKTEIKPAETNLTKDTKGKGKDSLKPNPSVKNVSVNEEQFKEKLKATTNESSLLSESLKHDIQIKTSQEKHIKEVPLAISEIAVISHCEKLTEKICFESSAKEISYNNELKISEKLDKDSMKFTKKSCERFIESEIKHCSVVMEELQKSWQDTENCTVDNKTIESSSESRKNDGNATNTYDKDADVGGTSVKDKANISKEKTNFIESIGDISKQTLPLCSRQTNSSTNTDFRKDSIPETNLNIHESNKKKMCKVSRSNDKDNAENVREAKKTSVVKNHSNIEYKKSKWDDRKSDEFKNKSTNEKKHKKVGRNESRNSTSDGKREVIRPTKNNPKNKECNSASIRNIDDSKDEGIQTETNDNKRKNLKVAEVTSNHNRNSTSVSKKDSKADRMKNETYDNKEKNENDSEVSHSHNKNIILVRKKCSKGEEPKNDTAKNKKKIEKDPRIPNRNNTAASKKEKESTPTEKTQLGNYCPEQVKLDKTCKIKNEIDVSKSDKPSFKIEQNRNTNKGVDAGVNSSMKDEQILDLKMECHKENEKDFKSVDFTGEENVETNIMKYKNMKNILQQNVKVVSTDIFMIDMIEQKISNGKCLINSPRKKIEIKSIVVVENGQEGPVKTDLEELNSETSSDDATVISKDSISKVVSKKLDDLIKKIVEGNAEKTSCSPKNETDKESNKLKDADNNKSGETSHKRNKRKRSNSEIRKSKTPKKDSVLTEVTPEEPTKHNTQELYESVNNENIGTKVTESIVKNVVDVQNSSTTGSNIKTPENSIDKTKVRRRITPIPVKDNIPVCSFQNILEKNQATLSQNMNVIQSPLHLTHDGEIPVLHLEENHINNLPTECNINDKNIMTLLDTMNISNMDCDMSKFKNIDNEIAGNSEANVDENYLNISPIKRDNGLTFKNVIDKVTSTPICKAGEDKIQKDHCNPSIVVNADKLIVKNSVNDSTQTFSTFRRKRRRVRMVILD